MNDEPRDDAPLDVYRILFEGLRDGLVVCNGRGDVLAANRAAREMPSAIVDGLFTGRFDLGARLTLLREEMQRRGHARVQLQAEQHVVSVEVTSLRGHWIVCLRDTTGRARLEEELRALRRLDSAAIHGVSVVHDLRNLLMPIETLTEQLASEVPQGTTAAALAHDAHTAAVRARRLARDTLDLMRGKRDGAELLEVNALVAGLDRIVRQVAERAVEVSVHLAPRVCLAVLDRERLENVILNLVANARDAMPQGGKLTLTTTHVARERGDSFVERDPQTEWGGAHAYVALSVADTGVGMSTEVRERMFDRFFTTKEPGQGTGLGLTLAHSFVHDSGGFVGVRSEPGSGTVVTLYFPCAGAARESLGAA